MNHGRRPLQTLTIREWALLAEAGSILLSVRFLLRVLPIRHFVQAVRRPLGNKPRLASRPSPIARCVWAVRTVSRHAPVNIVCLPQALALHRMLWRRGIASEVLYGVARIGGKDLAAHAWLRHGKEILVGEEAAGEFTVMEIWRPSE